MKILKVIKYIFVFLISFLTLVCAIGYAYYKIETSPKAFAQFIKENTQRASMVYILNDSVVVDISSHRMMPLASTLKWLVLIEYCKQVESNKVNPISSISIKDISKYYLPNSDGDAHPKWLKDLEEKNTIKNQSVKLREVVTGMIAFSSNANTEFLMDYLNLDSINNNINQLNIRHDKLTYLVSYTYLIANSDTLYIKSLSNEKLQSKVDSIHILINQGKIKLNNNYDLTEEESRLFNERMTKSTTREYADLMKKLNRKEIGGIIFNNELDSIYSFLLKNEKNSSWLKRIGMKGGSTIEILTMSSYAQNTNGDKIELVYFLSNLEILEYLLYKNAFNAFNIRLLKNNDKGKELIKYLKNE